MDKSAMRQSAIYKINQLDESNKKAIEQRLLNHLLHTAAWIKARTVGITISQGIEWNTTRLIEKAWEEDKVISVPKCYPEKRQMVFYRLRSFGELEVVYRNLHEPKPIPANKIDKQALDLLIVPGLLFDRAGFRLGFGGGYYDRFLSNYTGYTMGLTSSFLLVDDLPKESHDRPVQTIITDNEIIEAKGWGV